MQCENLITWLRDWFDDIYLTEHQDIGGKANTSDLGNLAYEDDVDLSTHDVSELTDTNDTAFTPKTHTHDDRYYTESEMDSALSNKADTNDIPTKTSDLTNDGSDGVNVFVSNNDSRLSDARTPTSHNHSISNVTNLQTSLNNKLEPSDLLDLIYPIGSIYIDKNTGSTVCPIQLTLGGTWTRIENKFLYASENGQGVGVTGGEESVSLTESQMPRHTHIQNSHNHTQNSHQHQLPNSAIVYYSSDSGSLPNGTAKKYVTNSAPKLKVDSTTATNQATTATNKYTGGSKTSESASNGVAHNNMPPYLIVNVWQRVEDPE